LRTEEWCNPSVKIKFSRFQERSTGLQGGQTNGMQKIKGVLPLWIHKESGRQRKLRK
jgi:hypothetical protein